MWDWDKLSHWRETDKKQVAAEATRDKQKREAEKQRTEQKGKREKRAETEGEFQCPGWRPGTSYLTWSLWGVLCGGGGGNSWSWTVATHVSSSVHSLLLFLSLSGPSSPPFLSLSFLSSAQTLTATICPRLQPGKRRGNSTLSRLAVVVGVHRSPSEVPPQSVKWSGVNQFPTRQHKHNYVIVLIPDGLLLNTPGWQACQSLSSLAGSLSLWLSLSLWVPIRPVGPHFSCLPGLCLLHWEQDFHRAGSPRAEAGGALLINRSG